MSNTITGTPKWVKDEQGNIIIPKTLASQVFDADGNPISESLSGKGAIPKTQAEYDAMSEEEKKNGSLYIITDAYNEANDAKYVNYTPTSGTATTVADELDTILTAVTVDNDVTISAGSNELALQANESNGYVSVYANENKEQAKFGDGEGIHFTSSSGDGIRFTDNNVDNYIGSTDLSAIGDGTITGAISTIKSSLGTQATYTLSGTTLTITTK